MKRCLAITLALALLGIFVPAAAAATYKLPPTGQDQWYWEISAPSDGLAGLPSVTGAYPSPGSANIWDTDMFADSNTDGGVPTGASPVVQALHAAGKYSICYIEAGAQQAEFRTAQTSRPSDYTNGSDPQTTEMQGWPGEYWYDIRGFANYVAGASVDADGGSGKHRGGSGPAHRGLRGSRARMRSSPTTSMDTTIRRRPARPEAVGV